MPTNAELVADLCESWPHLSREEIVARFTEDARYINVPFPGETVGGAAVADVLIPFRDKVARIEAVVRNVSAAGDVVFAERVETFHRDGAEPVVLPVVGVFEVRGSRICAWRDYFDAAQMVAAFS